VERTARQLEAADRRSEQVRRRSWTAGVNRALIVVCVFFIFQQITGINVPLCYGPHLLAPLFQAGSSKVASTIAGVEVTAIMTAVNVAATYLAFRYIDRIGRRKLAVGGYTAMALSALLAGVGGTGWLLQGEVFPTAVRGKAASMGATVDWLANFALIVAFPTWQSGIARSRPGLTALHTSSQRLSRRCRRKDRSALLAVRAMAAS
jgi:SP family arabinose:H+ symporter-like MFS transporter